MGLFSYLREQRQKEREMFLAVINEIASRQDANTNLLMEQTKLLSRMLDMFDYSGTPKGWTVRDADEAKAERERLGIKEDEDFI